MKNILLLRHAKSDWYSDAKSDFERPLNDRGKKDAPLIGLEIAKREIIPDHILSSPAKRAKQTTEAIIKNTNYKGNVEYVDDFYFGSIYEILDVLKCLNSSVDRIMLVGHNPTWEQMAENLIDGNVEIEMSTASLISLNVSIHTWEELKFGICQFNWLLKPKMLKN